jgi:hypothetical protein
MGSVALRTAVGEPDRGLPVLLVAGYDAEATALFDRLHALLSEEWEPATRRADRERPR